MKIGLLSDTHGYLDPKIFDYFQACDEIWHAGDVGDLAVVQKLENFKPVRIVYGNIDQPEIRTQFPLDLRFQCEELEVWITHIGGRPPRYNPRVKKLLREDSPDIFVCGHSHILAIKRDAGMNNMLYLNPGAAGNQGFHKIKTLIRFEVTGKKIEHMEVIELGKRGIITL